MRIARFLVISAFAAALALPSVAEAQSAGRARLRRPTFNPFSALRSRFDAGDRFGGGTSTAVAATSTTTAAASDAPAAGGSSFQAALLPMRPPFRPPVRSPFRPPPRPPF